MKLSEAIKALEDGKKIRQRNWGKEAYLLLQDWKLIDHEYKHYEISFHPLQLVENWEIYEEPNPKEKYKTVKAWFCTSKCGDSSMYVSEKTIGPNQSKLSLGVGSMPFIQEIQIPES